MLLCMCARAYTYGCVCVSVCVGGGGGRGLCVCGGGGGRGGGTRGLYGRVCNFEGVSVRRLLRVMVLLRQWLLSP